MRWYAGKGMETSPPFLSYIPSYTSPDCFCKPLPRTALAIYSPNSFSMPKESWSLLDRAPVGWPVLVTYPQK
jgi:hypothetical protein